jgi:ankyrin repeat protein
MRERSSKQPKRKERAGVDEYGRTPLHYAANGRERDQVHALIAGGAAVSLPDDNGWTPLHFAAQGGSAEVVTALLAAGAAVDPQDADGNTPLWRATMKSRGNGVIIGLLRAAGADPHVDNKHGVSPVELARTIANYDVGQFFTDV